MITRTAYVALARIERGLQAFRLPIRLHHSNTMAVRRREALQDLYARRLIRRGPRGPEITETGRRYLADLRATAARNRCSVLPPGSAQAERYGLSESVCYARRKLLRQMIASGGTVDGE